MTIYIDLSAGSRNLPPYMTPFGIPVVGVPPGRMRTDIEWLGQTGLGPTPIGAEHKSAVTGDIFTAMSDGRLTGTQLPKAIRAYPWIRYLIIEGPTRRSHKDGLLEVSKQRGKWESAAARKGQRFTWEEYRNRIESIGEFFSYPHCSGRTVVVETIDVYETAAWIARAYHYWQKPYEQHQSARQWDRSGLADSYVSQADVLLSTTSRIPLATRWAREIDGIGQSKAAFVGQHFKSGRALANASAAEWELVECRDKIHSGPKAGQLRAKHFGKEMIAKFVKQIEGG